MTNSKPSNVNLYTQIFSKKEKLADVLTIFAMLLLSIDTAHTFISQGKYGFLPLTDQQSGILLGIPSIVLFFLSFVFAFRARTRLTTLLLISGGALLATSKLVEPTLGLNLFLAIVLRPLYIALILMGFTIMGLGVARIFQESKRGRFYY
jgi:hypothetical protein